MGPFRFWYLPRVPKPRGVLVTGATGYLGSLLARRLAGQGFSLTLAKRSTSSTARVAERLPAAAVVDVDRSPLERAFAAGPELVVHCAADYGRGGEGGLEEANVGFPTRLLELAAASGAKAFVNTDTTLPPGVSEYADTKRAFSERLAAGPAGLCRVDVALELFYGPGDSASIVTRLARELLEGRPEIALTPGEQRRDFVFIDDVLDAYLRVVDHALGAGPGYLRFEVGSGRSVSIRELAAALARLCGNTATRLAFGKLPYRPNEPMESRPDLSAIKALGWSPKVGLEEGLSRLVAAERAGAPTSP